MDINIKPMTKSDITSVSEIVSNDYMYLAKQEGFSPEQLERLLTDRSSPMAIGSWLVNWQCFVAELHGNIVGAIAIWQNEIEELWVHPQHHSHGVGTAMFREAEQMIAKAGHTELTLCCAAVSARPFYEAMGAEIFDRKLCSFGPLVGWALTYYKKKLGDLSTK